MLATPTFLLQRMSSSSMLWTAPPPGARAPKMWALIRLPRFGGAREPPGGHRRDHGSPRRAVDEANGPERHHGGIWRAARLSLSTARSRHQVHSSRSGRSLHQVELNDWCCRHEPELKCLCGALGQVGEGRVLVQGDPEWSKNSSEALMLPPDDNNAAARPVARRIEQGRHGRCAYPAETTGRCPSPDGSARRDNARHIR